MNNTKPYAYTLPGCAYSFGPVWAKNERAARQKIRAHWGFKHLPRGSEVWRYDQ